MPSASAPPNLGWVNVIPSIPHPTLASGERWIRASTAGFTFFGRTSRRFPGQVYCLVRDIGYRFCSEE